MTFAQKYIVCAVGILLWVFGLSILLSTVAYGYLDLPTVRHIGLVLAPVLILAAVLLYHFKRTGELKAKEERVAHFGQTVTVKP